MEPNFVGAKIEDNHVVIRWPLNSPATPSKSGKTLIIAGTGGFMPLIGDTTKKFSLNVTAPKA